MKEFRNTKEKGDWLESHVYAGLFGIGQNPKYATKAHGDIASDEFLVECKNINNKKVTIDYDHWKKIDQRAQALDKTPLYVRKNSEGEVFVALSFYDFLNLVANS